MSRPPPIEVNAGDILLLHAANGLDEPMTLHHHGLFFGNVSWFDGVMDVTQWYEKRSIGLVSKPTG